MTEPITLSSASLRCDIKPALGRTARSLCGTKKYTNALRSSGVTSWFLTNPKRKCLAIKPVNLLLASVDRVDEPGIQVLAASEWMSAHINIQVEPAP